MKAGLEQSRGAALLRGFGHAMVRLYYPRIEVTGTVPREGPVLLAANHPNSLLDPPLLGIAAQRPVRLLAKAPLFRVFGLGRVMRILGMIPAHRGRDATSRQEIKRNLASLSQAALALGENGGAVVGIFPEGKSHDDLQVALVRSGAARLAMQAARGGVKGLRIVPVGLNYESKDQFRTAVWINIGAPIEVDAWWAKHGGDQRQAMRALTPEIDRRLKEVAIHLVNKDHLPLLIEVEGLMPAAQGLDGTGLLQLRRRVAQAINLVEAQDPDMAAAVGRQIREWAQVRRDCGLPADARFFRQPWWQRAGALILDIGKLATVLVLAVPGLLHHLLPHVVTRVLSARFDQPGKMTVALHRLLVGMVVHPLWTLLVWVLMMRMGQPWVAWTWLAIAPLAGLAALWLGRRLRVVLPIWWAEAKLLGRPRRRSQLRGQREALRARLMELAQRFPG